MTASVSASARGGANSAVADMEGVNIAKSDMDNVAVFTKFIKKAEDTAQAAL